MASAKAKANEKQQQVPDLVVLFDYNLNHHLSRQDRRDKAQAVLKEYQSILNTLHNAGLVAAGKLGNSKTEVMVLISCPLRKLYELVEREKHSDFLHGVLTSSCPPKVQDLQTSPLSPSDRIRLIHDYITSSTSQNGLGLTPGNSQYPHITSVFCLHDHTFNKAWIDRWTRRQLGINISDQELDIIRNQFGESVALYYSFLATYTKALLFPTFLGITFWKFRAPYHPVYSALIVLWSIVMVEWWRIRERKLAVRWGSRGAFRVEKRRVEFDAVIGKRGSTSDCDDDNEPFPWWQREIRILTSLPVIALAALALTGILTGLFIIEAFVTHLYTGPGHQVASLFPTILFAALVPQFMALYQKIAARLTNWENHAHQSTHDSSLTIKTFALSAIIAYLGLALSAFVYVPFGEAIMATVHMTFFAQGTESLSSTEHITTTASSIYTGAVKVKPTHVQATHFASKLDSSRLQNQMFAYTVTNQIINTFLEIGLPYVLKAIKGRKIPVLRKQSGGDEKENFLEDVKEQATRDNCSLFFEYSEMVTQFGYVGLYSTIWPLAPLMALINNWLELRSDAFKVTAHLRRPVPVRSDTIGPWLENMSFISWLAALTNTALIYLFRPHMQTGWVSELLFQTTNQTTGESAPSQTIGNSIVPALLLVLSASHGYWILHVIVRHLLGRALWNGSPEAKEVERKEKGIKESYLKDLRPEADFKGVSEEKGAAETGLWADEGRDLIEGFVKTA